VAPERGARWFYVLGPTSKCDGEPDYRARMSVRRRRRSATGRRPAAPSPTWSMRGAVAAGERIQVRQGVEIGRSSDLYLSANAQNGPAQGKWRGSPMYGWGAALFSWQGTAFPAMMHMLSTGFHTRK